MEKERKFRFVGDPFDYGGELHVKKGEVYTDSYTRKGWDYPAGFFAKIYPEDWEEVTEPETTRIPNQDQPASSMTKFEMAVFMYLPHVSYPETAIERVNETFKQLEKLKK